MPASRTAGAPPLSKLTQCPEWRRGRPLVPTSATHVLTMGTFKINERREILNTGPARETAVPILVGPSWPKLLQRFGRSMIVGALTSR